MLSLDEYRHLKQGWSVLRDKIEDARKLGLYHRGKMQQYKDLFDNLKLEEKFYIDTLRSAREEYEAAHPPEETE